MPLGRLDGEVRGGCSGQAGAVARDDKMRRSQLQDVKEHESVRFPKGNHSCYRFIEFRSGGSEPLDFIIVPEHTRRLSVSLDSARREDCVEPWNLNEMLLRQLIQERLRSYKIQQNYKGYIHRRRQTTKIQSAPM